MRTRFAMMLLCAGMLSAVARAETPDAEALAQTVAELQAKLESAEKEIARLRAENARLGGAKTEQVNPFKAEAESRAADIRQRVAVLDKGLAPRPMRSADERYANLELRAERNALAAELEAIVAGKWMPAIKKRVGSTGSFQRYGWNITGSGGNYNIHIDKGEPVGVTVVASVDNGHIMELDGKSFLLANHPGNWRAGEVVQLDGAFEVVGIDNHKGKTVFKVVPYTAQAH